MLACCEGKTWKSHVFFAGGHDAGLVCTKPGWVYAHVCSEERREAKKKMGRFQWRLPIRRPALNKSGEISLSLSCVCVCPCDVLQRVKWAASWPSSLGLGSPWKHGRTCPRDLSAVQCSVHRVYPTTRVVVVVLLVDIPCISSMPQAQFDICAFHPSWLVSWIAREHCVDPRRTV